MSYPVVEGYVLTDKLGSGSYATVYKAFKQDTPQEIVAIKCVERARLSVKEFKNIILEITLLRVLKHDHVVEMKNFKYDERFIYIIMEFCDGGDLSQYIKKHQKLPEAICEKFLQQLGLALRFLRSHEVCHMDLKPKNLLLTTKPRFCLKLGDFGLAQYISVITQSTALRGSPLYMAPEMLLKRNYDARVDLWSVGVIMYECLFGRAPYYSKTLNELMKKLWGQAPIQIPPGHAVSPKCADLLLKLLQQDPDKRISYDEFFEHPFLDLEHYPCQESLGKAFTLVTEAVKCDSEQKYWEAFKLYSESLRYFVPLVNAETDVQRKGVLRGKVNQYVARAEMLKRSFTHRDTLSCLAADVRELGSLCTSSPNLASALEIGNAGEQYLAEEQYRVACDKFEAALAMLLPALKQEPKGKRRDMLYRQTQIWLHQAEICKKLISVTDFAESTPVETKEWCKIQ